MVELFEQDREIKVFEDKTDEKPRATKISSKQADKSKGSFVLGFVLTLEMS